MLGLKRKFDLRDPSASRQSCRQSRDSPTANCDVFSQSAHSDPNAGVVTTITSTPSAQTTVNLSSFGPTSESEQHLHEDEGFPLHKRSCRGISALTSNVLKEETSVISMSTDIFFNTTEYMCCEVPANTDNNNSGMMPSLNPCHLSVQAPVAMPVYHNGYCLPRPLPHPQPSHAVPPITRTCVRCLAGEGGHINHILA